jgi:hypothetical protein
VEEQGASVTMQRRGTRRWQEGNRGDLAAGDQDRGGVGDDAEEGVAGVARRGGRRRGGEGVGEVARRGGRRRGRSRRSGEGRPPASERIEWYWGRMGNGGCVVGTGDFWLSPRHP